MEQQVPFHYVKVITQVPDSIVPQIVSVDFHWILPCRTVRFRSSYHQVLSTNSEYWLFLIISLYIIQVHWTKLFSRQNFTLKYHMGNLEREDLDLYTYLSNLHFFAHIIGLHRNLLQITVHRFKKGLKGAQSYISKFSYFFCIIWRIITPMKPS